MKKSRLFNPVNQFFIQYNLGPVGMKLVLLLLLWVFLRIVLDGFFLFLLWQKDKNSNQKCLCFKILNNISCRFSQKGSV